MLYIKASTRLCSEGCETRHLTKLYRNLQRFNCAFSRNVKQNLDEIKKSIVFIFFILSENGTYFAYFSNIFNI